MLSFYFAYKNCGLLPLFGVGGSWDNESTGAMDIFDLLTERGARVHGTSVHTHSASGRKFWSQSGDTFENDTDTCTIIGCIWQWFDSLIKGRLDFMVTFTDVQFLYRRRLQCYQNSLRVAPTRLQALLRR
jgi:hypothetical protein